MDQHGLRTTLRLLIFSAAMVAWTTDQGLAQSKVAAKGDGAPAASAEKPAKITATQRKEAAKRYAIARAKLAQQGIQVMPKAAQGKPQARAFAGSVTKGMDMPMPTAKIPHYFGPYPNYANSPMPKGAVTDIVVDQAGSGYTAPVVTISDVYGTGSGATATATLDSLGGIASITITNGGAGYTAPVVTINDSAGGTGTDALASATIGGALSGGIRKFVNKLPGLTAANANDLGQYITVAIPDITTYPGSHYYEIEVGQYTEQLHSDLPPTTLRGYRQTNTTDATVSKFHYLGPLIVAERDTPVRIKFTNKLPTGTGGDLFLPVDTTVMGAGMGPNGGMYTQNRATLHLHGGLVPWISDGTPHQWTTPAGESTAYPKGVSVQNVPDMPPAGDGSLTFYYNNQQSARLMFYHDHSYGITRLNVYAGEAAGYLITDLIEQDLINGTNNSGVNPGLVKVLPDVGIPLIIQDKTFVDASTIGYQDPNWRWGSMPGMAMTGDLWLPSVYVPAQNPWDLSGANPFGRWMYGPWFWPPTVDITKGPIANPYADPMNPEYSPLEPPMIPDMPNPSMGMEAFMDTAMVNGTVYPYVEVDPKTYRFRVLNAANDRFVNLQMYVADSSVTTSDGRTNTELKMVPASRTTGFPAKWPTDGREGGVPDPKTAGPSWIQIGTEGGFLPAPVVIPNQPINWNRNQTAFNAGNVSDHSLLLGPAERADVIVDFSAFAGKTLILYNDAPAAFPALDPRYDYYTGNPDQTGEGGTPPTQPGFGPNTRTVMQIRVAAKTPATAYSFTTLKSVFAKDPNNTSKKSVFEAGQDPIIVPQAAYTSAYNPATPFPSDITQYVRIHDQSMTFTPLKSSSPVTIRFQPKAIHDEMGAAYDTEYGRMSGLLGLELLNTNNLTQNILLYGYASPPVDVLEDVKASSIATLEDGTQIWKITHNGVDTHPIHFHLANVQLINRVAWDNAILPPDPNELGWKETIRVNPLEDTIVAMRPIAPTQPFDLPNSVRLIDPTMPEGARLMTPPGGYTDPAANGVDIFNHYVNFGWEYVWHCHILSHEEMDMMHSLAFAVAPKAPANLTASLTGNTGSQQVVLSWTDASANETSFTVQKADAAVGPWTTLTTLAAVAGTGTPVAYTDTSFVQGSKPYYRVFASNKVGDTTTYANSIGFPTKTMDSPFSNTVQVGTATPPAAPTDLTATLQAGPQVLLAWTDNATDENGFVVERSDNDGAFVQIATPGPLTGTGTVNYTDTTVIAGHTYAYRVAAVNGAGPSGYSNTASVSVPAAPAAPSGVTATASQTVLRVTLNWQDIANNETGYTIQRATDSAFSVGLATFNVAANATSYNDNSVALNTAYFYRVRATGTFSNSAWANATPAPVTTPPVLAPTNLRVGTTSTTYVILSWTDNANNEQGFYVERSTNGGATWTRVGQTAANSTTYRNNGLTTRTTYQYRVQAYNANGVSAYSNTLTVTTR